MPNLDLETLIAILQDVLSKHGNMPIRLDGDEYIAPTIVEVKNGGIKLPIFVDIS